MIVLTAKLNGKEQENPNPFIIGKSLLGYATFGVYIQTSEVFDRKNLISLEAKLKYRSDDKLPSYGIISNVGNISFRDSDNKFSTLANLNFLSEGQDVQVYLENTLYSTKELVGVYKTDKWEYDNDNKTVSVSLKDDLEEWQNIQTKGISFDPREPFKVISNSLADIYDWLQNEERTPSKYQMLPFEELDEKTKNILYSTSIEYPLIKEGTLWEQWTKLCEACGLYIYKDKSGKTICSYTFGS